MSSKFSWQTLNISFSLKRCLPCSNLPLLCTMRIAFFCLVYSLFKFMKCVLSHAIVAQLMYNPVHNIWELYKNVAQFPLTNSKTEFDIQCKKRYTRVASRVAERLKTRILGKNEISENFPKLYEDKAQCPVSPAETNFRYWRSKIRKNRYESLLDSV